MCRVHKKESHLCCSYEMEHRETGVYKQSVQKLFGWLTCYCTVYVFLCVQMVTGRKKRRRKRKRERDKDDEVLKREVRKEERVQD